MKASGEFEVKINPMDTYVKGEDGIKLGRMSIDKSFKGDLEASSQGEMLSAMTTVQGSAGYVAIEQVYGNLFDKQGSFVLQHYGTMQIDNEYLKLEVVPNSGTGELTGLSGKMTIEIKDGKHFYKFNYELKE